MSEIELRCDCCGREVHAGRGDYYAVSIVAVADPMPPVVTEEERAADVSREIRRLVERLAGRGEESLVDEVVREVLLRLCVGCYREWMAEALRLRFGPP
jgi:hypothetical protein